MVERVRSKKSIVINSPANIILSGRWIDGGSTFRVWYVSNGEVKMVDASGSSSREIDKAMRAIR